MSVAHKGRTFRPVLITIFKVIFISSLAFAFLSTGAVVCAYLFIMHDLPTVAELQDYQPKCCPQLSAVNFENAHISTVHPGLTTDLGNIPPHVVNAFLALEDWRLLKRPTTEQENYDLKLPLLFFFNRTIRFHAHSIITYLIARDLLPPFRGDRPFHRIRLAMLTIRLTKAWKRKKILYVFLKEVYLGNGCFGVDAAARFYFGKSVQQLTIAEAAQIAGLVKCAPLCDPFKYKKHPQQRKDYVLRRMHEGNFITKQQYKEALKQKLVFKKEEQKAL